MLRNSLMLLGMGSILLLTAGCLGYEENYPAPPPLPPEAAEPPAPDQHAYNVAPKPNPHKETAERTETSSRAEPPKTGESATSTKNSKASEVTASNEPKKAEKTADAKKPLTPAEIRTAVSVQKVSNPKQTLSSAKIKSLWGDVLGHVRSVDVSGGTVKSVDADVGEGVVRIDASRLKYVKSRNVLVTTMSKPDVAKLPRVDNP